MLELSGNKTDLNFKTQGRLHLNVSVREMFPLLLIFDDIFLYFALFFAHEQAAILNT